MKPRHATDLQDIHLALHCLLAPFRKARMPRYRNDKRPGCEGEADELALSGTGSLSQFLPSRIPEAAVIAPPTDPPAVIIPRPDSFSIVDPYRVLSSLL